VGRYGLAVVFDMCLHFRSVVHCVFVVTAVPVMVLQSRVFLLP
jgi:hypothetical protein